MCGIEMRSKVTGFPVQKRLCAELLGRRGLFINDGFTFQPHNYDQKKNDKRNQTNLFINVAQYLFVDAVIDLSLFGALRGTRKFMGLTANWLHSAEGEGLTMGHRIEIGWNCNNGARPTPRPKLSDSNSKASRRR